MKKTNKTKADLLKENDYLREALESLKEKLLPQQKIEEQSLRIKIPYVTEDAKWHFCEVTFNPKSQKATCIDLGSLTINEKNYALMLAEAKKQLITYTSELSDSI